MADIDPIVVVLPPPWEPFTPAAKAEYIAAGEQKAAYNDARYDVEEALLAEVDGGLLETAIQFTLDGLPPAHALTAARLLLGEVQP